jgi:hypothetical protein
MLLDGETFNTTDKALFERKRAQYRRRLGLIQMHNASEVA